MIFACTIKGFEDAVVGLPLHDENGNAIGEVTEIREDEGIILVDITSEEVCERLSEEIKKHTVSMEMEVREIDRS